VIPANSAVPYGQKSPGSLSVAGVLSDSSWPSEGRSLVHTQRKVVGGQFGPGSSAPPRGGSAGPARAPRLLLPPGPRHPPWAGCLSQPGSVPAPPLEKNQQASNSNPTHGAGQGHRGPAERRLSHRPPHDHRGGKHRLSRPPLLSMPPTAPSPSTGRQAHGSAEGIRRSRPAGLQEPAPAISPQKADRLYTPRETPDVPAGHNPDPDQGKRPPKGYPLVSPTGGSETERDSQPESPGVTSRQPPGENGSAVRDSDV